MIRSYTHNASLIPLVGLVLLSVAAYFGFRSIFSAIELDIRSEALVAAFGALFVLLPTKFLMEQEGESRLKGEKRSAVFNANLGDYKEFAVALIDVLKDRKITSEELSTLRQKHAFLVLLGSNQAIKSSRDFIIACQEYMEESDDSNDEGVNLNDEQQQRLWDLTIQFLATARAGLDLAKDDFDFLSEKSAFSKLNDNQTKIEEKFTPRRELVAGFDEWCQDRKLSSEQQNGLKVFVNSLRDSDLGLELKYTKSTISIRDTNHEKERRVLYVDGINKKNEIKACFNVTENLDFFNTVKEKLSDFSVKSESHRGGKKQLVRFTVPITKSLKSDIEPIQISIKKYIAMNS